jgi:hypothetical protein
MTNKLTGYEMEYLILIRLAICVKVVLLEIPSKRLSR